MKSKALLFVVLLSFFCVSCSDITSVLASIFGGDSDSDSAFTNAEAVQAMRAALNVGIEDASGVLSNSDTGYYYRSEENGFTGDAMLKILLPDEADKILDNMDKVLSYVGGQDVIDDLVEDVVLGLNRTAEDAAKDAVPIFATAIKDMTVADGINIVRGEDDAATKYLKDNTYDDLLVLYSAKIDESLDKPLLGDISTNTAWENLKSTYNTAVEKYNTTVGVVTGTVPLLEVDLSDHATEKALDGLFYMVAQEEAEIRENPLDYASDIIKKVFGAVKSGL